MSKQTKVKPIGQDSYADQNCQSVLRPYNAIVKFIKTCSTTATEHVADLSNAMSEEIVDLGHNFNQMSTSFQERASDAGNDFKTYFYRNYIRPEPTSLVDQTVQVLSDGFEDGSNTIFKVAGKVEHFFEEGI